MITKDNADAYPMSPLQQGMLFHTLSAPRSGVEIEQVICKIKEPLDLSAFNRAMERVVDRHAIFRTRFQWEGIDEPIQIVEPHVDLPKTFYDWRAFKQRDIESALEQFLYTDRLIDFKMNEEPLMRCALFDLAESGYIFVWTYHHALIDGRSLEIALKELFAFYEAFIEHRQIDLPLPRPYHDFIDWLQSQDLGKAEKFWRESLIGFTAPTPIRIGGSSDYERTVKGTSGEYGEKQLRLSAKFTAALKAFVNEHDLTMNTLFQGAWALLLHHYSGKRDVVFGATRACRHSTVKGSESMVGLFINTLPIRVRIEADQKPIAWLRQVRKQWVTLREYEHSPLHEIQRWCDVPSGLSLFDSLYIFNHKHLNTNLQAQGGRWLKRNFVSQVKVVYPLELIVDADAELLMIIRYHTDRFDQATVRRMLGHLHTILKSMLVCVDLPVEELPYLTSDEKKQLLVDWNPLSEGNYDNRCIHQRFEQQADATPNSIAVVFENQSLTYLDLNCRANHLARQLGALGVEKGTMVALYTERSLELIVGILGILKAGGAYVPLDPAHPKDRLAFILEDTQAPVLVTQQKLLTDLPPHSAEILCVDGPKMTVTPEYSKINENPAIDISSEGLAYVIYTSGSTGKPKGVLVTHGNVTRLFDATNDWYHFGREDVWTLFHTYAFDFSVWEIWGALIYGGKLVVVPHEISRSPKEFYKLMIKEGVTVLNQTPSAFLQLIQAEESLWPVEGLSLRLIIFGGEALDLKSLKPWVARHGDMHPRLVNMYGITETTVHVTYRPITAEDVQSGQGSVIGVPIPDLQIYVLDANLQPVPIGVIGELYVGGAGLARGYLNRPNLTRERFIENPFSDIPGDRLYKTGDLARYLSNRDLGYLGRADQQLQIRGFRVEPGEIETVLTEHEAVSQVVVVAREYQPGDLRLIAYFVPDSSNGITVSDLRDYLRNKLPSYMIPQYFVEIDVMPLTANGKVDKRALPQPQLERQLEEVYVQPQNEIQKIIAGIWQEILHVEKVGMHDNFFDLGGHSLLLTKMQSKLQESFDRELPITEIFRHPTIAMLASFFSQEQEGKPAFMQVYDRAKKQREILKKQKNLGTMRRNIHE